MGGEGRRGKGRGGKGRGGEGRGGQRRGGEGALDLSASSFLNPGYGPESGCCWR